MSVLVIPLIVCGGAGSRLWPISHEKLPKQFLPLIGSQSTFQTTVRRVSDPSLFAAPLIITHLDCEAHARAQLASLGVMAQVLVEPSRRNSGPAILAGVMRVAEEHGDDAIVLSLAADHWVDDECAFRDSCRDAFAAAEAGAIVTFGIAPDHPATGYGYIEPGERRHGNAYEVRRFIEKPDAENAARFVQDGLLWNSGNLLFRARTLLDEYRTVEVETSDAVAQAVSKARFMAGTLHLDEATFAAAASRSIDHAVLERTARVMVVKAAFDWADIGAWPALHRLLAGGQTTQGRLRDVTIDVRGSLSVVARRAEYWIVAEGTARIAGGELTANEFIRLAAGESCAIENGGEGELRLIAAADEP